MSKSNGTLVPVEHEDDEIIATLLDQVQEENEAKRKPSEEQKLRDAVSAMLQKLGSLTVQEDALTFQGTKFVLPQQYEGKVESAIDFLINHVKQERQTFKFHRTILVRPYDGAHGFMTVMKELTGSTGFGKTIHTMFGPIHPQFISVNTDIDRVEQVPWGEVHFPMYEATFNVGATHDTDWGVVFHLGVEAPRKWRKHIEGIFTMIENYLKTHSIYRGKAIDGAEMPTYIDALSLDEGTVVYNTSVLAQLEAHVWVPIVHSKTVRGLGISLNRKVLFAGPFGTGKTLGCKLTAKKAVQNGWTFVMCRAGKDDPAQVMQTAALYSPAVVVIEDLDVIAEGGSKADISRMLDALDGFTSKDREIVCLFTTNHIEDIQRGALRPGRIDAVIEIAELDEPAFQKLVRLSVGDEWLEKKIDWSHVAEAYKGFLPAFVREAAVRAQRFTMGRNEGKPGVISTNDLVYAANSLRPQLDRMLGAHEGATERTMSDVVRDLIDDSLNRTALDPNDYHLTVDEYNPLLK